MPDLRAVRTALATQSGRVVRSVGDAVRMDAPVPGLDWNAGQLTAHLCAVHLPAQAADELTGVARGLLAVLDSHTEPHDPRCWSASAGSRPAAPC
ncbi:hypothetical protein [Streptomyces syringium]|uniref:hypothetical protein n=1 Tax=Streptomyces syringium TaxID=76729 RepID=UPI0034347F41